MLKNPFVQSVVIVLAALVIALGANAMAGRQRKLLVVGFYPDALRVPPKRSEIPPPPVTATATAATTTSTTTAPAATETTATIAPVAETVAPVVTTTQPPATATTTAASPPAQPAPDPLARFQPHPDKAFVEISGEDAMLLHAKGVLFLDARRTSVYEDGHIAGSRPFSVWESDIDDKVNALFAERSDPRDQNLPIVIYCSGGACEDSHMLAQKLWGIQFNNVYVYKDGFPDWQKRGGAVKTGAQP